MDFPLPVSPVSTVQPSATVHSMWSIRRSDGWTAGGASTESLVVDGNVARVNELEHRQQSGALAFCSLTEHLDDLVLLGLEERLQVVVGRADAVNIAQADGASAMA